MTQIMPIVLVAVMLASESDFARHTRIECDPAWTVVGMLAAMVGIVLIIAVSVHRLLDRRRRHPVRSLIAADRLLRMSAWTVVAAHAGAVLVLGWLDLVRSFTGNLPGIDEAAALLPAVGALCALWAIGYSIERRTRDATRMRRMDIGMPIHPLPPRGAYVFQQMRVNLLFLLVPLLLIVSAGEALEMLGRSASERWVQIALIDFGTPASALCIFMVAPLLMRFILDVQRIPEGELRHDLQQVCQANKVKVRDLLLWRTGGLMINAAVMGLIRPVRFVLVTDGLIEAMSKRELIAVMAHEVGHVRRHHMPWLLVMLMAILMIASVVIWLPLWALSRNEAIAISVIEWTEAVLTGGAVIGSLVVFGWVSRRFERQADTFAVQHLVANGVPADPSVGDADELPSRLTRSDTITPDAVYAMTAALGRIADINFVDPNRPSWRHGSIAWRQAYLWSLIGQKADDLRIDRVVRRLKLAAAAVVVSMIAVDITLRVVAPPPARAPFEVESTGVMVIKPPGEDDMRNPSELETGVASTAARDRAVAFTKMHGIGNDFLVIELSNEQSSRQTTIARLQRAAVSLCDRRKGVGADGLLLVDRHVDGADARMVVINADGGVAEMCGNGLRCVCKYFVDRGDLTHMPLRIATGAGVLSVEYTTDVHGNVDQVTVDMGVPRLAARDIPVSINGRDPEHRVLDIPIDTCMQFDDQDWLHAAGVDPRITAVSMGNPHVIIYCDHLDALPVQVVGPQIEHHPTFPERTNVHFVQRLNREQVVMRTWERGSGLTQACGTGACAVCVAGVLTDRTSQRLVAHLPGGTLWLEWPGEQSGVLMTGSAETVFTGSIDLT